MTDVYKKKKTVLSEVTPCSLTTWRRHILQDSNLPSHYREKLKSQNRLYSQNRLDLTITLSGRSLSFLTLNQVTYMITAAH